MTNKIKSLLRKIFYIKKIKNFIIFLLRKKLISRRFRNLIQLNGFNNIFKSNIDIFNSNSDAVSRDLCIYGVTKKEEEIFSKFIEVIKNSNSFLLGMSLKSLKICDSHIRHFIFMFFEKSFC